MLHKYICMYMDRVVPCGIIICMLVFNGTAIGILFKI